ncbi:hypothetical protein EW146_g2141 [Bondarzewia mesenterica]|uniref:Small ribosomal subunit protein mS35 mitochondrial conserved domain-containing protein n=1 Tax=Bondarzewia mesenterica TaxID=1095465 RepID=A0A4S4M1J0_9AGAM|nr:hypothetical protein EW146_g2141 [Bondarzewia mesenterica]
MLRLTQLRSTTVALRAARSLHSSRAVGYPRKPPAAPRPPRTAAGEAAIAEDLAEEVGMEMEPNTAWGIENLEDFQEDDTTAAGHIWLDQQRQTLHYLRLIEHEMPKLVAFRKEFVPPTSETPIAVRSISYGGEEHPATVKRAIAVPVSTLPLKDKHAIYKFRLLAGVRWTPYPPKDSGLKDRESGEHGYIKISCEDFPRPAMNLKWASDVLDKLIQEANKSDDQFRDIPYDRRHLDAKAMKAKKGKLKRDLAGGSGRYFSAPSIRDFPRSWLPKLPSRTEQPTSESLSVTPLQAQ